MNFHLDLSPAVAPFKISYGQKILLSGSCFAEHIGDLLSHHGFDVYCNPSGIVFNPASIAHGLRDCIDGKSYTENDLIQYQGKWLSLHHHGSFSSADKSETLSKINAAITAAHGQLSGASWLVLTFGTAWSYVHKETNSVVANCHKIPQQHFEKKLLSTEELLDTYTALISQLKETNPGLRILLSISPVKYLRWGAFENNLGKSVLFMLVKALLEKFDHCSYFPAFELVQDDLRDYRFYKEDLAHPNSLAVNYVWEKFCNAYMDDRTRTILKEVQDYRRIANHIVKEGDVKAHENKVETLRKGLIEKYPDLKI